MIGHLGSWLHLSLEASSFMSDSPFSETEALYTEPHPQKGVKLLR